MTNEVYKYLKGIYKVGLEDIWDKRTFTNYRSTMNIVLEE